MATWSGQSSIKGTSEVMRMALLTFTSVGISFTWGVEMTYCTPYLLSLGLTKHQTAMVWVAGPLSGLIVQPVVGVISDQSTSKWGRRRPFILLCASVVACGLLVLGFTKEIVSSFIAADESSARLLTIGLAVLSLYAVDFAINAVMSCSRSLMVDTLPIHKQQDGAAWASRMGSLGHVIGYGAGAVDLVRVFGTSLGDTQFKKLTVVAAVMIFATASVTCWAVTERVMVSPNHHRRPDDDNGRRFKVFRQIWSTLLTLPPRMQAICQVVFWSWIGWFPFLIYSSTWVGETYFRYDVVHDASSTSSSRSRDDALGDMGRIGSTALTVYSTITFISAWILPLLVRSPDDDAFTPRPPARIAPLLELLAKRKPDLLTMWQGGQLLFAAAMALTPFVTSFRGATALVALCGIPWAITSWAPSAFLGIEVNKLTGASLPDLELRSPTSPRLEAGGLLLQTDRDTTATNQSSSGELSGIYFGIMNIYTVIPQFLSNLMSILVFAALEPGKSPELATDADPAEHHSTDGPNAIAVCLFLGAISTLVSASATRKLRRIP